MSQTYFNNVHDSLSFCFMVLSLLSSLFSSHSNWNDCFSIQNRWFFFSKKITSSLEKITTNENFFSVVLFRLVTGVARSEHMYNFFFSFDNWTKLHFVETMFGLYDGAHVRNFFVYWNVIEVAILKYIYFIIYSFFSTSFYSIFPTENFFLSHSSISLSFFLNFFVFCWWTLPVGGCSILKFSYEASDKMFCLLIE